MPEIKERPILFSAPMVRAILEGRKTVTRRAIKDQPQMVTDRAIEPWVGDAEVLFKQLQRAGRKCLYGQPGDRLWVRETFAYADKSGSHDAAPDDHWRPARPGMEPEIYRCWYRASDGHTADGFWKPSIHMPRWVSRILLEITDVRVERLQDISGDQAEAEGVDAAMCQKFLEASPSRHLCKEAVIHGFAGLWDSVGGNWNANPWVWVVEFKRIAP